jgi:hypothetical protein
MAHPAGLKSIFSKSWKEQTNMLQFRLMPALFALVFGAALCGWAYPTLYGETGLVQVPTADIMPQMNFEAGVHYTNVGVATSSSAFPMTVDYGVARGTELFMLYSGASSSNGFDVYGAGVKVSLVPEDAAHTLPGVSIGGRFDHFSRSLDQDQESLYVATSTTLYSSGDYAADGFRLRAHVGLAYDRFSGDMSGNFFNGFAGMSYEQGKGATIALDYLPKLTHDGQTYRDTAVSGSIRFPFATTFAAEIGVTRPYISSKCTFYAGFVYHYGENVDYLQRNPLLPPAPTIAY